MCEFGLKEAFEVYSKHRDVIIQMWSFYSVGTLAVVGYTVGSEKATRTMREVFAILVAYLAFAIGNAWAVVSSQRELDSMAKGIDVLLKGKLLAKYYSVRPVDPDLFILFYVVVSAAVSLAILLKYVYGKKPAAQPDTPGGAPKAAPH